MQIKKYYLKNSIALTDGLNTLNSLLVFLDNVEKKYNLEEENNSIFLCPICFDNNSDSHVSPCGHSFCMTCIQKFKNNLCPLCREKLDGVFEYPKFKFGKDNN